MERYDISSVSLIPNGPWDALENMLIAHSGTRVGLMSLTASSSEVPIIREQGTFLARTTYSSIVSEKSDGDVLAEPGFSSYSEDDRSYLFQTNPATD